MSSVRVREEPPYKFCSLLAEEIVLCHPGTRTELLRSSRFGEARTRTKVFFGEREAKPRRSLLIFGEHRRKERSDACRSGKVFLAKPKMCAVREEPPLLLVGIFIGGIGAVG